MRDQNVNALLARFLFCSAPAVLGSVVVYFLQAPFLMAMFIFCACFAFGINITKCRPERGEI